jgi:AsmA protein
VVVGVAGALVALLLVLALLVQTGPVSQRVKDLVVPRASDALGREVTVQGAKVRLFPGPKVSLTGASVAGRPGEPPLVEVGSLDAALELWPLVRSFGKDVRVDGIRLVRPVLNLVRDADGTWNYEGLGEGAQAEPRASPSQESKAKPLQEEPEANPSEGGGAQRSKVVVSHAAIEDGSVRLVDRQGTGEAALAVSRIDLAADHVGVGEPLSARLSAALASEQKNFQAEIRASQLPGSLATLGPGLYPELSGTLALVGLDLAQVRAFLPAKLTGIMSGGRVDASAKLGTEASKYRVDGSGKLSQVRLRGEPAQGGFDIHAVADPASGAVHLAIEKLALKGPGVDLGGNAAIEVPPSSRSATGKEAAPPKMRFAIAGPLLDLGQVMGLLPEQPKEKEQKPVALTAAQRRAVGTLDVQGTLDIEKVVKGAFVANDLKARAALDHGVFVLPEAHAGFFGGSVDAAGTRVDLAPALPTWNLKSKLDGVDLGQALTALSGSAPVVGRATGALDLSGAGVDWASLKKALTGQGALSVKEGALTTADLGGKVLGAVSQGLRKAGKGAAASQVSGATGKTELRDLAAQFTVKDGAMALAKPLSFAAPFGTTNLGGKIGLGGELALQGTASLSKDTLQRLAGGTGMAVPANLDVPLGLGGTLTQPSVNVNVEQAVAGLVSGAARGKAQELKQGAEERARRAGRRGLGDVFRKLGK